MFILYYNCTFSVLLLNLSLRHTYLQLLVHVLQICVYNIYNIKQFYKSLHLFFFHLNIY